MLQQNKPHGLVYVAQCLINDKFYVGQTINSLRGRWRAHGKLSSARRHGIFAKAIQKYGKENFLVQEISRAGNKDQLDNLEKLWIILLRSSENPFGYNRTLGGDGSLTDSARALMRVPRPQTSLKLRGRKRPQHVLDILRNSNLGRKHTPEWRAQHSLDVYGLKHTPETKKKMSEARKTFWEKKSYEEKLAITLPGRRIIHGRPTQ